MTTTNNPGTYDQRIAANMAHMQTALSEWNSVAITGFADAKNETGEAVKMPEFSFPVGYTSAPSLYKNSGSAGQCNCELCGHDIKNVYWLQNDSRKWLLPVGSECVTHFGSGQSGIEISNAKRQELNRAKLDAVLAAISQIFAFYTFRASRGYGRYETAWRSNQARAIHRTLTKLAGKLDKDTTDGAITRWLNRKADAINEALIEAQQFLASPAGVKQAREGLESKIHSAKNILALKRINGQEAADWQLADVQRQLDKATAELNAMPTAQK